MALLDFRAVCMPYCIEKQEDGSYLVLNREYKPLSFNTYSNEFLKQDLPIYLKITGLSPQIVEKIIKIGSGATVQESGKRIFLYNDSNNPVEKKNMKDYFERLSLLLPLLIE